MTLRIKEARPERLDGAVVVGEHKPDCGAVAEVAKREWRSPWSPYVVEQVGTPPKLTLPCNDPDCSCKLIIPLSRVPTTSLDPSPGPSRQALWASAKRRKEMNALRRRNAELDAENKWLRERVAELERAANNVT